jgi:hypothetical protein
LVGQHSLMRMEIDLVGEIINEANSI